MENFLFSLILLILVYFSSAASEVLSTGEVVAKFVAENLAQYDVSDELLYLCEDVVVSI